MNGILGTPLSAVPPAETLQMGQHSCPRDGDPNAKAGVLNFVLVFGGQSLFLFSGGERTLKNGWMGLFQILASLCLNLGEMQALSIVSVLLL